MRVSKNKAIAAIFTMALATGTLFGCSQSDQAASGQPVRPKPETPQARRRENRKTARSPTCAATKWSSPPTPTPS